MLGVSYAGRHLSGLRMLCVTCIRFLFRGIVWMFQSSVFLGAVQSGKEKTDYLHVSMTRNESGIPIRQAYKEKKRPKTR